MIRPLSLGLALLLGRFSPIVAQSVAAESTSTAAAAAAAPPPAPAAPDSSVAPSDSSAAAPDSSGAAPSALDSLLAAAAEAIAHGLPYRASRMLDSIVADSARRTPEATLLAARAASRWGGWPEVNRLIAGAVWTDPRFRGPALLLAARAALEVGADSTAVVRSRNALAEVGDPIGRAQALVVLGRAQARLGQADSAAAAYARAAALVLAVGDWLRLRAAALTADSAGRAVLYSGLRLASAKGRVPATEAAARERFGDLIGAATFYLRLGSPATALRLRLAASLDTAARAELRHELLELIGAPGPLADRRAAIAVLDSAYGGLAPEEDLVVARAAGAVGLPARAADGFSRAFAAGLGGVQDRFDYAGALFRLGRYPEAADAYTRIPAKDRLGGAAAYQRGRALLRGGQLEQATQAFRQVWKRFPKDTAAATPSLYLLADLATDDRRDGDARKLFLQVAHRFPATRFAPGARLQAALIALIGGHARQAAHELESLAAAGARAGDEGTAALYWAGRAWAEAGDSARARDRWAQVMARDPVSYYAGLSERRLSVDTWRPPAAPDSFARAPGQDSAMARATLLGRLGLADEARAEYAQVARDADTSVSTLLSAAHAFRDAGLAAQGIRLARSALARGAAPDARLYRLLYPVVHAEALVAEAGAHGLEPGFVAALIRQESLFDPGATSGAGARGLMQVMPDVGATVARSRGFPQWDPVLLWQPDVSLVIGTLHLAELAARYADPVRILAAYNAGISRVDRWAGKNGMDDPEVFAERIPFVETRDYVRIVQRNRDLYRVLYGW